MTVEKGNKLDLRKKLCPSITPEAGSPSQDSLVRAGAVKMNEDGRPHFFRERVTWLKAPKMDERPIKVK